MDKHNPGPWVITDAASDPYGGYFARTFPFTVTANETRSVVEDSPAGTSVGDPVTGKPYNGETLAYTLEGIAADSRHFATDAATGQIRVKQGVALDRETRSVYPDNTVEYKVQDQKAVIGLIIEVTDCPRLRPRTRPRWRRRKPGVPTPRPCWPWTGKRRNQQPCLL